MDTRRNTACRSSHTFCSSSSLITVRTSILLMGSAVGWRPPQSRLPFPPRFNGMLARLCIGDRLVRSKVGEASPGASALLANYRNVTLGNENPAFVTRLDAGQATLIGRKRELAPGDDSGHHQLQWTGSVTQEQSQLPCLISVFKKLHQTCITMPTPHSTGSPTPRFPGPPCRRGRRIPEEI